MSSSASSSSSPTSELFRVIAEKWTSDPNDLVRKAAKILESVGPDLGRPEASSDMGQVKLADLASDGDASGTWRQEKKFAT